MAVTLLCSALFFYLTPYKPRGVDERKWWGTTYQTNSFFSLKLTKKDYFFYIFVVNFVSEMIDYYSPTFCVKKKKCLSVIEFINFESKDAPSFPVGIVSCWKVHMCVCFCIKCKMS
uniref:Uncharacterized protein n=1 Tax=Cacopsylla melanoneura TaxID=428564 RepID=A0A8D8PW43_9HEMI